MEDHLDEFNKTILDLENIDIKVDDEEQALLLLQSLPKEYKNLHDTLVYGRDSLTLEEVQSALMSKELKKKSENRDDSGEGLMVRGRSEHKDYKQKDRSRSKFKSRKCFLCKKEVGHFKKNCPERRKNKKRKKKESDSGDVSIASDGYESAEVLMATDKSTYVDWVLDSGCSFHMCPVKE